MRLYNERVRGVVVVNRVLLRLEIRLNILARLFPFDPGLLLRNSRHDISNSARWCARGEVGGG